MAGWTYTGPTKPIGVYKNGNADGLAKATAFPALAAGNIGWWQDFAYRVGIEFGRESVTRSNAVATLIVSANNSTGDTLGVGVLTITLTTA